MYYTHIVALLSANSNFNLRSLLVCNISFFGVFERPRGYLPQHNLELLLISTTLQRPIVLPVLIGNWICSLRAIRLHLGLEGSESAVACSFCRPLRSSYQTCRLQPVSGWPIKCWPQLWGIIKLPWFQGIQDDSNISRPVLLFWHQFFGSNSAGRSYGWSMWFDLNMSHIANCQDPLGAVFKTSVDHCRMLYCTIQIYPIYWEESLSINRSYNML